MVEEKKSARCCIIINQFLLGFWGQICLILYSVWGSGCSVFFYRHAVDAAAVIVTLWCCYVSPSNFRKLPASWERKWMMISSSSFCIQAQGGRSYGTSQLLSARYLMGLTMVFWLHKTDKWRFHSCSHVCHSMDGDWRVVRSPSREW